MEPAIAGKAAVVTIAVGSTPAEFAEFLRKEQARWGEVVRKSGVKAE